MFFVFAGFFSLSFLLVVLSAFFFLVVFLSFFVLLGVLCFVVVYYVIIDQRMKKRMVGWYVVFYCYA